MKWYDISEFVILAVAMVSVPISFHWTIWCLAALIANCVIKIVCGGGRYNKEKWWLWLPLAYWTLYLISILWTENHEAGWTEIGQALPFALFALWGLFSDLRYLSLKHIRQLLWVLTLTLTVLFLTRSGIALYRHRDALLPLDYFFEPDVFDPIHHIYLSLYLTTALAFLYREATEAWTNGAPKGAKLLIIFCAIATYSFTICKNSRAAHVVLLLLAILVLCDQILFRKQWKCAIILAIGFLLLGWGTHKVIPTEQVHRTVLVANSGVEATANSQTTTPDHRIKINQKTLHAAFDNLPLGVGAGDRMDVLYDYYTPYEIVYESSPKDPHNQYSDTLLATGIVGFLLLCGIMLVIPILIVKRHWHQLRQGSNNWLVFTGMAIAIPATIALFESILERQLGILFFFLLYTFCTQILVNIADNDECQKKAIKKSPQI